MDLLKRALSLPMLFKDWDDPLLGFRKRKSKMSIFNPNSDTSNTHIQNGILKNEKRKSKRFQTWNRLVESRSTSKIPTVVEAKGINVVQSSESKLSTPDVSAMVSTNNTQCSSCDLAPTLLSIYDNYASNNKLTNNKNGIIKHESGKRDGSSANSKNLSQSCHNVHWSSSSNNSNSNQQKSQSVEILNGNMDEDIHMKDVSCECERQSNVQYGENVVNISVSVIPCDDSRTHTETATTHHTAMLTGSDACSTNGQNTGLTACINSHIPLSETDAKKRPLSVSSTSSSVSSSSSLPRHQRKKIATMAACGVTPGLTVDQYCDLCKQHGECPHKLQRFDVLHSGQCSCAQSSKEGQLRHVCRVHGPAVDISIAKSLCPNCNHSRTGLLTDHSHICDISEVSELTSSEISESDNIAKTSLQVQDLNRSISDPGGTGHNRSPSSASISHRFVLDLVGSYMGRVVHEVIETENVYVNDLRDINQGYIEYLDNSPDINFNSEEKEGLFGNIQEIYEFNREFLENLDQCELDPVQVAQCFVDRTDGFLIYTDYCTNYPRSVEVLTRVMQDETLSEVFKRQQMYLQHALPLGSYLLKPVQRILKYHLFLENMLNNFDKCKSGYDVILLAFQSMTDMAQHINEMKRQHECAVHIQEIQSTLFGWDGDDLTTYGKLVLEDTFRMHGAKAYRRVYLFEKGVIIAKRKEDGNLLVKGTIKCSDLMLVESIPKEPLSFHVIPFNNPRMQYTLQARNLDHKHKWCQEIKRLMIENYQAVIPDKAKELMMMLGKSKEEEDFDENAIEDQGLTKKQHTAPEYLERRRQRRRSTSIIPDFGLLKTRRGRRQSEEATQTSSPSSMVHNKSEPSGFVSYLTRKPSAEDVQEEDEDNEALSETTSSTRGSSSKGSTLDSQVVTFDGFTDNHQFTPEHSPSIIDKNNIKLLSFVDIDIEESCVGAKRISRIDSDDAILQDDNSHTESLGKSKDLPLSKSVFTTSPLGRNGSYRKAYELNRTDSVKISKQQSKGDMPSSSSFSCISNNVNNVNVEDLDDGYVGVVFSNNGVTIPSVGESSTDDNKDYIILPHFGESSTDSDHLDHTNHISSESDAQVIANNHAKAKDDNNIDGTTNNKGAITKHYNQNNTGATVVQNFSAINIPKKGVHSRIYADSPSQNSNETTMDLPTTFLKTSTPVSQAQMTRSTECSPIQTSTTTVVGSLYSIHNLGSPVRVTSDLKNGLSQSKLDCSDQMDTTDPWVPRKVVDTPCTRFRDRIRKPVFRQYSMNAMDVSKKIATQKRISKLYRSNSCTSLDDSKSDRNNAKHFSHRRMLSDTSTLLFTNKTAFIASECPHTIKHSPEVQRTLARYGTPPREYGPDYLLEEINECKEKGKAVTRYATPPREVMDPSFMIDGQTYENKYTCALESEILENLRKEMQQSAIMDNESTAKMENSVQLPQVRKMLSNQNNEGNSDNSSHKKMWNELQEYLQTCQSTSGNKLQLLAHDMALSSNSSRHGSFSSAMSNTVISPQPINRETHVSHIHKVQNSTPASNNDSIVDSLKSAVMSLTSRITRRSPRSVDASPVRIVTRRARSLGAEEDARIKPVSSNIAVKLDGKSQKFTRENSKENKKGRRSKFVFQLARTYSEKLKRSKIDHSSNSTKMPISGIAQQTSALSKETISKVDIISVGERMADVRPKVLGTYTLQRHKPVKSKQKDSKKTGKDLPIEIESDSLESNSSENMDTQDVFTKNVLNSDILPPSNAMCVNLDNSGSDMNDEPISMESFYEQQCNDALECQLEHETYRDSAVYSDDGAANSLDSDYSPPENVIIKETKEKLVRNNSLKETKKLEVKRAEKGEGIKNILKSLEAASSCKPKVIEPNSPPIKPVVNPLGNDDALKVKMSPSLKRNKCRELMEVAMLSRIRQNSFDGLENDNDEPLTCACDCDGVCSDEVAEVDRKDDCEDRPKTGWVKQVVSQIQDGSICS